MVPEQKEFVDSCWKDILASERFSMGKYTEQFEDAFAKSVGRRFAVAVSSGTAALDAMFHCLDVKDDDGGKPRIFMPCMTWPSSHWMAEKNGLHVFLTDVGDDFLIKLGPNCVQGTSWFSTPKFKKTDILFVVTTGGIISPRVIQMIRDWPGIVLEDSSHSHGSVLSLEGQSFKAGTLGKHAIFSLYGTKAWQCGEGGVLVTDDDVFYKQVCRYVNCGKDRGSVVVRDEGVNYRMSEMQAALALSYVKFKEEIHKQYTEIVQVYGNHAIPCLQEQIFGLTPSWYKYIVPLTAEPRVGVVNQVDFIEQHMKEQGYPCGGRVHNPHTDNQGDYKYYTHSENTNESDYLSRGFYTLYAQHVALNHVCLPIMWTTPKKAEKTAKALFKAAKAWEQHSITLNQG